MGDQEGASNVKIGPYQSDPIQLGSEIGTVSRGKSQQWSSGGRVRVLLWVCSILIAWDAMLMSRDGGKGLHTLDSVRQSVCLGVVITQGVDSRGDEVRCKWKVFL